MAKRDLRQMKAKKKIDKNEIKEAAKKANINVEDIKEENIQNLEEAIEKYGNKSESELMSDLERMVADGRKNGTFSDEMLEAFVQNVAPMMDDGQRRKLDSIINMLRSKK